MNLRVDLILPSEQRSGSLLSLKSLARIATVVGPVVVGLLIALIVFSMLKLKSEQKMLASEWELTEPQREAADKQLAAFQRSRGILRELEGWQKARLNWHAQMAGLVRVTPLNVQLQSLRVSQTLLLVDDRIPARAFALDITGRAVGSQAESGVKNLERQLTQSSPFAELMKTVNVPTYRADTSKDASREDRVFSVVCAYEAVKFE